MKSESFNYENFKGVLEKQIIINLNRGGNFTVKMNKFSDNSYINYGLSKKAVEINNNGDIVNTFYSKEK